MRPTGVDIANVLDRHAERYSAWENGRATSPSTSDLVYDAEVVLGHTLDESDRETVCDAVAEAEAEGADPMRVATLSAALVARPRLNGCTPIDYHAGAWIIDHPTGFMVYRSWRVGTRKTLKGARSLAERTDTTGEGVPYVCPYSAGGGCQSCGWTGDRLDETTGEPLT